MELIEKSIFVQLKKTLKNAQFDIHIEATERNGARSYVVVARTYGRISSLFEEALHDILKGYLRFDEGLGDSLRIVHSIASQWVVRLLELPALPEFSPFCISCDRIILLEAFPPIGTTSPGSRKKSLEIYQSKYFENPGNLYRRFEVGMLHFFCQNLEEAEDFFDFATSEPDLSACCANMLGLCSMARYSQSRNRSGEKDLRDGHIRRAEGLFTRDLTKKVENERLRLMLLYNLARLHEVNQMTGHALKLYESIFSRSWTFFDVRDRLRNLSPAKVMLDECRRNLRNLASALNSILASGRELPEDLAGLVPTHVSFVPSCPSGRAYGYLPAFVVAWKNAWQIRPGWERLFGEKYQPLLEKKRKKAIERLENTVDCDSASLERLIFAAYGAFYLGDHDLCERFLAVIRNRHPDLIEALYLSGRMQMERGEYKGALETCEKTLMSLPGHAPSLLARGYIYSALSRYDEAGDSFRMALNVEKSSLPAALATAALLLWHKEEPYKAYFFLVSNPLTESGFVTFDEAIHETLITLLPDFRREGAASLEKQRISCPTPMDFVNFLKEEKAFSRYEIISPHIQSCELHQALLSLWEGMKRILLRFQSQDFAEEIVKGTLSDQMGYPGK